MNTIRFYQTVLKFLARENRDDLVFTRDEKKRIIDLAPRFAPSWVHPELDLNEIDSLAGQIVHSSYWEQFILAAFRDLSIQRHALAHQVFSDLMALNEYAADEDMILWAKKIIKRKDGSATIILHTSHLDRLEKIIELGADELEGGAIRRFFDKKNSGWMKYIKSGHYE